MAETIERRAARRPQVLSGMRDFLPQQMLLRQHVMGVLRRVFEAHGFEPFWHQRVPPNDGGIALGQVVVAGSRRREGDDTNHVLGSARKDTER